MSGTPTTRTGFAGDSDEITATELQVSNPANPPSFERMKKLTVDEFWKDTQKIFMFHDHRRAEILVVIAKNREEAQRKTKRKRLNWLGATEGDIMKISITSKMDFDFTRH